MEYNEHLLTACLAVAARYRKISFARACTEYTEDNDNDIHFQSWTSVVRAGARVRPPAKMVEALETGLALAYGVYYRDEMLVEIALLLGAQLGENCKWAVWDSYPESKCLVPFGKAYYSKESGAEEVVQLIDAKFPCPFGQCK